MSDLPAPPGGWPVEAEPEAAPRFPFVGVSLIVFALAAVILLGSLWLGDPAANVKLDPAPKPAPIDNASPCAHDSFDANYCAVKMVQGASQATGVSPYTVISVWCAKWSTPREQRRIVRKWIGQGAHPDDAQAVLEVILRACPPTEGAA